MSRPPLIGISARIYFPAAPVADIGGVFTRTLHYLEQSVAHWILGGRALAVMIPAIESQGMLARSEMSLAEYASQLDGLVLQGGNDIAPESYGETPLRPEWSGDRVRDRYEIDLFDAFVSAGKPVVGICRGCQLINVALGGTLYQDIPSQRPSEVQHLHVQQYDRQFHDAEILPGSGLARLYPGVERTTINSIHHQAVKDLGRDLVVEARSVPDGLVEAIRWRGPSLVFGMQWHPEFMAQDRHHPSQLDGRPILEEFLAACLRRRG
ncbi:transferase [Sphaerotilus natans subsp. natans DSM 6575]|jgi:putative glutamine amidotransferase|uniref:Transferase n=1 Tax=Sphaerotilus natans subsp. natans DSM 6575 TaxID=1286631 RepID=A0A059KPR0_9BURK|nr:gamma-glutamyl-gamma-aminobutyrate hydrolase family protein [Sphaerotilus natans]KDB53199.1 transferase [Sphaerotilus natans subsp. natans DSM 6575]SIR18448.1 putative glutamine amidotransferase [Sphaerotilus natans]